MFLLIALAIIAFQDIKYRKIHVTLPFLIFGLSLFLCHLHFLSWKVILGNAAFFLITFSILTAYMSLKNKKIINPFEAYFGLGDFLYFLAVTPLFYLKGYMSYFIFSLLFSLVVYYIFLKFLTQKTIPLAGFASLFLILVIGKDLFLGISKMTVL